MPDLVDAASAILAQASNRAEIIGENLANATSPAFKARVAFSALLAGSSEDNRVMVPQTRAGVDLRPGKLVHTGKPYDLALNGIGFFAVQRGGELHLTRAGRFSRTGDGRLVDAFGGVLQSVSGSDIVVTESDFEARADGRIVAGGAEVGRIAIYRVEGGEGFSGNIPGSRGWQPGSGSDLVLADGVHVVQGSYEASNVSTGEEMVRMMQALRLAETGQRLAMTYDDLMGRAIATFGESMR